MPTIIIEQNPQWPFEAAAQLLSIVAYPDARDRERQLSCFDDLCWFTLDHIRQYELSPDERFPTNLEHAMRDRAKAMRGFKQFGRQWERRLVAGRMAIALLNAPSLPRRMKRASINEAAALVTDEGLEAEVANVKTRVWNASRPVIHIAAALAVVAQDEQRMGEPISLQHLLLVPHLLPKVISEAERNEQRIERMAKPFVDPANLIRLRLS